MIERNIEMNYRHRVVFTHGVFDASNPLLGNELSDGKESGGSCRMLVFVDEGLLRNNTNLVEEFESYASG